VQQLDEIIDNWVRWHARKLKQPKRCMSLERNWRPGRYYDAPPLTLVVVDQALAVETEAAWKTLPDREKFVLKWHYVFTRTRGTILRDCRKHGFPFDLREYDFVLQRGRSQLFEALAKKKKCQDNRANAVVCAMSPPWEGDVPTEEREAA
jgi:hypothetical protein